MADTAKTPSIKMSLTAVEWKKLMSDPFKDGNRIITDAEEKGLELRIIGKKAAWVTRYKKQNKTIGFAVAPANEKMMLTTPKEARVVHNAVKDLIDMHPKRVDFFLPLYYSQPDDKKKNVAKVIEVANYEYLQKHTSSLSLVKSMSLEKCYQEFIRIRTDGKSKQQLKYSAVKDYDTTFKRREVQPYMKRSVIDMSPEIAERLRDQIAATYGPNPAKKWVSHLKTVLNFTMKFNRAKSGLDKTKFGVGWWLTLTDFHVVKRKTRKPSLRGVAVTMALAEHFLRYPMPGRDGIQHGVRPNVFAALIWTILSCQRVGSGLSLRRENFIPDPFNEGWMQAEWQEGVMKNSEVFVLPIPPAAHRFLEQCFKDIGIDSEWAFPSERGSEKNDIHVNRSAVLSALRRLAGIDVTSRKKDSEAVNLYALNDENYWSPHDIRRALTAFLENLGVPGGASVVLAHKLNRDTAVPMTNEELAEWRKLDAASVTRLKYGNIQHLSLKQEALEAWVNAVLKEYEKVKAEGVVIDTDGTLSTDTEACKRKHEELLKRYAENKRKKKAERADKAEVEDA